jgi:hypothetical protein
MIRRYGFAVVGVLLPAGMVCAVVLIVPATHSAVDRLALYAHNVVGEKLLARPWPPDRVGIGQLHGAWRTDRHHPAAEVGRDLSVRQRAPEPGQP